MSVLVTGATGFIAQHIVKELLQEHYKVIGTARSQEKADRLMKLFDNPPGLSFEIVKDIAQLDAFDHVLEKHGKDIKVVLHTASPFHYDTTEYEKDLLIPAVNGTKGILESIKKYAPKTVERVVVTSSFAAIMNLSPPAGSHLTYTEADWNPVSWEGAKKDGANAYCGSKKFAEETAWTFLKENEGVVSFKLSTVNPVFVFGPQCFDQDVTAKLNTSCEMINSLIHATPDTPVSTTVTGSFIDVRDVAKAHLLAFQKKHNIGKRLLVANGPFSDQDLVNVLNENFEQLKGTIPKFVADTEVTLGKTPFTIDNSKSKELLGFKFKTLEESVNDTATQILRHEGKL